MAMYQCSRCARVVDNDYHPCLADPWDDSGIKLICPACYENLPDTPQVRQGGVFTKEQLAIIKRLEEESDDEL